MPFPIKYGFSYKYQHGIWNFIAGTLEMENSHAQEGIYYEDLINFTHKDVGQIEKDVKRTFNNNVEYSQNQ